MPDPHPPAADPTTTGPTPNTASTTQGDGLANGAAQAVLAVPAVDRLEPALWKALHRLRTAGRANIPAEADTLADGVTISRRGSLVDIHVDLAVTPTQPADLTARAAQTAVRRYLIAHQLVPGTITVAVLTIQR